VVLYAPVVARTAPTLARTARWTIRDTQKVGARLIGTRRAGTQRAGAGRVGGDAGEATIMVTDAAHHYPEEPETYHHGVAGRRMPGGA
jgi:hypothetical protein